VLTSIWEKPQTARYPFAYDTSQKLITKHAVARILYRQLCRLRKCIYVLETL